MLVPGEGVGVFLHDPDTTPPVLAAKVQTQAIARVGGPQEAGEGAGESIFRPQEDHIVHLGLVLCLTDRHPDPVDCGFRPVNAFLVCRH